MTTMSRRRAAALAALATVLGCGPAGYLGWLAVESRPTVLVWPFGLIATVIAGGALTGWLLVLLRRPAWAAGLAAVSLAGTAFVAAVACGLAVLLGYLTLVGA